MTTKTQLTTTGYQKDVQGHWIEKDPEAKLIYSMDWSDWLLANDQITSVQYTVTPSAGANDIDIEDSGQQLGYLTYCELSKGVHGETYTVAAKVTTADGRIDTRRFRIKCKNRFV
jgi:hypothetical protein